MIDPFWLSLAAKMVASAAVVVAASLVVERLGSFLGAMVATLPISAGPAYVILALEHGPDFIRQSSLSSLAVNAVTAIFIVTYAALAQSRNLVVSLAVALTMWLLMALLVLQVDWTLPAATILNIAAYGICFAIARRSFILQSLAAKVSGRPWWAIPARALGVMGLVGVVVLTGRLLGSTVAGIVAVAPVTLTSLVLVLQPRMGGPATASVLTNGLPGLAGFGVALAVVHMTAISLGSALALTLALAICVCWNAGLVLMRR